MAAWPRLGFVEFLFIRLELWDFGMWLLIGEDSHGRIDSGAIQWVVAVARHDLNARDHVADAQALQASHSQTAVDSPEWQISG